MLQLREKHLSDAELLRVARDLRAITAGTNTQLVINDRPDIAALCRADFLHLGQDDIPIDDARKIVGDMKIGLSTHSMQQAQEAMKHAPAYIGFGPIYPTNAKANPDKPVGTELLQQVLGIASVPVVAIGGIFPENIHEVVKAGATNVSLVRHFMSATSTSELQLRLSEIQRKLNP
jgi:thiamine-phosphate pyrophosphorylase